MIIKLNQLYQNLLLSFYELSFFWEEKIPVKIFGDGVPCKSDDELMNNFYIEVTK